MRLPHPGIEVAAGVYRFGDGHVNWYVVDDGGALSVIDGGMPSHWPVLLAWLAHRGQDLGAIEAIVLTHGHPDHLGIIRTLADATGQPVWVHAADEALAKGHGLRTPPRRLLHNLWRPRVAAMMAGWARAGLFSVPPIIHAAPYLDGQCLDIPGTPQVIHTPGHSRGSSCLVLAGRDAVLTGDALVTADIVTARRGVGIMPGRLNDDPHQALRSLDALTGLRTGTVLPGHGEPYHDGVDTALREARHRGINWDLPPADAHGHTHATAEHV
jgi:glyoxylase-like metal-dependent hydrolase (beta-lactamase superfamily II)